MRFLVSRAAIVAALFGLGLSACDSSTAPGDATAVRLWVASGQGIPAGAADRGIALAGAADIVLQDDNHTLEITSVQIVLREIELERLSDDDCDDLPGADDDCEEFEIGPMLLDLPLDGSVKQVVEAQIPADVYDEIEFEIHKPDDDTPEDLAFLTANPTFKGVSIRVMGTFDGEDFVFEQDMDVEQEIDLVPPLTVAEGSGPIELTLELDVTTWFVRGNGTLIDPQTANKGGPNEDIVEDNIERSIEVFEDDDLDGDRDDG